MNKKILTFGILGILFFSTCSLSVSTSNQVGVVNPEENSYQPHPLMILDAGRDIITYVNQPTYFEAYALYPLETEINFEWDFNSDGKVDYSENLIDDYTARTSYIYTSTGTYYVDVKASVDFDNSYSSTDTIKVIVKEGSGEQHLIEKEFFNNEGNEKIEADGVKTKYAVLINGGKDAWQDESDAIAHWEDVNFTYYTLVNDYGFQPDNIFLFSGDLFALDPYGENPNNMIDNRAHTHYIEPLLDDLSGIVDNDDIFLFLYNGHGGGYCGSENENYGYTYSKPEVDTDDEKDYPESDFKLRALYSSGFWGRFLGYHHGMNEWRVREDSVPKGHQMFRQKFVSHFENIYFEQYNETRSDNDVLLERLTDYLAGDYNRDGYYDKEEGEILDYDGDGDYPFELKGGKIIYDEDDWGDIDYYRDDFSWFPAGRYPGNSHILFDAGLDGTVDIDLNYDINALEIDGTDEDNDGLFDWMDVNDDGDTNDYVSMDEYLAIDAFYDDEVAYYLDQIDAELIIVVIEACFCGGFIDDLSGDNRIIITGGIEEDYSYFYPSRNPHSFFGFIASALHKTTPTGETAFADTNFDGRISFVEAFNYASFKMGKWGYDLPQIPQYDDNGDKTGHSADIPKGGDGDLGSVTFLGTKSKTHTLNKYQLYQENYGIGVLLNKLLSFPLFAKFIVKYL
jgi:hypothetical protein